MTERAAYIGRIRNLSRAVAQAYYDSRERLGFPCWIATRPPGDCINDDEHPPLLVELLTEELPPKALQKLGQAYAEGVRATLARHGRPMAARQRPMPRRAAWRCACRPCWPRPLTRPTPKS